MIKQVLSGELSPENQRVPDTFPIDFYHVFSIATSVGHVKHAGAIKVNQPPFMNYSVTETSSVVSFWAIILQKVPSRHIAVAQAIPSDIV